MARSDLARFREATYRLVGQTFLYPDEKRLETVAAVADELWKASGALAPFAFYLRWRQMLGRIRELDRTDVPAIQSKYVSLFAANQAGVPCPPYESNYREPSGQATGWVLAQLEGTYAAAGVSVKRAAGEMPDHVAVETEYLAFLCGREADAWAQEDAGEGAGLLKKEKHFLDHHLNVWFPLFERRLAAAAGGGVFSALAEGAQAFMRYDSDLASALLEATPRETRAT